jgi:hypothetical protein
MGKYECWQRYCKYAKEYEKCLNSFNKIAAVYPPDDPTYRHLFNRKEMLSEKVRHAYRKWENKTKK